MFIAVGVIGVVLLLVSILFDDMLDAVFPDVGIGGAEVGAFLAAFGLFGWAIDENSDVSIGLALVGALVGGVALGYLTYRFGKALWNMPTDATPTAGATVGAEGRVVTTITAGRVGEVLVSLGGQPVKFYATSDADVGTGARVVVIAIESETKVRVEPAERFWGELEGGDPPDEGGPPDIP
jgi:membrane protein implicated in regulation of membrane protease activity